MQQNDDTPNTQQEVSLNRSADAPETPETDTPTTPSSDTETKPAPEEKEPIVDDTEYLPNAKEDPTLLIRTERKANKPEPDIADTISLFYSTVKGTASVLSQLEAGSLSNPAGAQTWLQTINNAENYMPEVKGSNGSGLAAWREGAQWRQFVEHEGQRLRVRVPKLDTSLTGGMLSGDAAVHRLQQRMSLGTHLQWPLWNSGIWVTFVPPTEAAILELQERINREKILLGRETNGAVFDNYQVYIVDHVMRFAMSHISGMTLKTGPEGMEATLESHMLVSDIPNLMLGVLCSIYPNGYDLSQPCVADITKCIAVHTATVSLSKMYWVDITRLNDTQRKLMVRGKVDSVTSEEVMKYQGEFAEYKGSVLEVRDGINIVLQVPTLATYRDSGRRWVDGIERDTVQVFGTDLTGREREDYMFRQAVLSTLQAYSHWFKHIVIVGLEDNDDQIIEDRESLERVSKTLSADPEVVKKIEDGVRAYNDQATCTIIGIVNYNCPKCGKTQLRPDAPNQIIVPIDVVGTFFTLLSRRLARILQA
jgi:hypothetical protein